MRRLFAIASVLSLLLFMATVTLWASGHPCRVEWKTPHPPSQYAAGFDGRTIYWSRYDIASESQIQSALSELKATHPQRLRLSRADVTLGMDGTPGTDGVVFFISRGTTSLHLNSERWYFVSLSRPFGAFWGVEISMWIPTLTFILLPVISARAWVRQANALIHRWLTTPNGLCVKCRYDLTGNTSGNCPECGSPRRVGPARQDSF